MDIKYKVNDTINANEIIEVFNKVGWNKDPNIIVDAFKNSYYVTAREDDKLVGFARAISDGFYYTGIYDVVVLPSFQKKGIGYNMMKIIIDKFKGQYFFLTYTEGNRAFYEKCGFADNNNAMWIQK